MSEKIKGLYGSETRAHEVLRWLESQGNIEESQYRGCSENTIYYVDKGIVKAVDKDHSVLFEIVELPKWRATVGGRYYFINYIGKVEMKKRLKKKFNINENDLIKLKVSSLQYYAKITYLEEKYINKIKAGKWKVKLSTYL